MNETDNEDFGPGHPDYESPEEKTLKEIIRTAAARLVVLWHPDNEGLKLQAKGCFITINLREEMDW